MRMTILCLALTAAMSVVACSRTEDGRNPSSTAPSTGATTDSPSGSSTAVALEDTAITAKVKAALAMADDLKDSRISVETVSGRVILTGKLPTESQQRRAIEVARAVDGVQDVENRLTVGNS
ncbi:MAG: BON domain-containing protein [Burkholderiales bacterium]|nr:BON domain-containing protein [Burkholderiales bacterium]